ncbi:hypothetical protein [Ideonella sp.]|uniref:hypothetical protein n=1 Tax=Ideonella sp. TaxID=1929293 RepID=UPI002B4857D0|nr:hypothetical protein [Ideonella sp.]HJV69867.1 hypothetical protein [Ideonella sp.]
MFKKILIANRGDNGLGAVAVKTHVGKADVMSQPHRVASEASGDRAAGADRV